MFIGFIDKLTKTKLWFFVRTHKTMYMLYKKTVGKFVERSRSKLKKQMNEEIMKNGMQIIEQIEEVLDQKDVCYFVCAGTLLGSVRDGRLIPWDDDIDFGIVINPQFTWRQLEACMQKLGYSLKYQYKSFGETTEQTYVKGIVLVDFYNHFCENNKMYSFGYYRENGFTYQTIDQVHAALYKTVMITGSKKLITPDGAYIRIPIEAEEYLRDIYGDSWRTPNPSYIANSGPSCTKLGEKELGIREQLI